VIAYAIRRLLQMPIVLLAVASMTFVLIRFAPGGPYDVATRAAYSVESGEASLCSPDAPFEAQYVAYLRGWMSPDVDACTGYSLKYPARTVRAVILEAFPVSLQLGLFALLVALFLGFFTGVLAAVKQGTWTDRSAIAFVVAGISVPNFVLGPLLVLVFSLWLGWVPPARWAGPSTWILPSLTLGTAYAAYIARLTRAGVLEIVREDFMRTARAKGLPPHIVVFRHGLRGGLLPVVSYLGPASSAMFTGSVVVERIFSIPGLGNTFIDAALSRDYNVILGVVLVYAIFLMAMNLVVDVLYGFLDPRVRVES